MVRAPVAILAAAPALALPAGAAGLTVRNCSEAPIDVALRDGSTPSGPNRSQTYDLVHRTSWSGRCSTDICWAYIKLASSAAYEQTADDICVAALTATNTQVTHPIAMCGMLSVPCRARIG
ncbi:MAG: hypothetical protein AB7O45_10460 [Alphaproteobacteria bacterium]